MQLIKKLFLGLSIVLLPTFLFGQNKSDSSGCYTDSIKNGDPVFHKIELNAGFFKSYDDKFTHFLIKNMNHNILIPEPLKNSASYSDTARVKFIISKFAIMSNLQVKGTKNETFKFEIENALKKSSCYWFPGEFSGRKVNGWYQYDFFYSVELKNGELNVKLNYKAYDFADDEKT